MENMKLILGIDIGTTSISVKLIDTVSGEAVYTQTLENPAEFRVGEANDYALDAELILNRTAQIAERLTSEFNGIVSIGITGQMHGIVCLDGSGNAVSPLYTWQNQFGAQLNDDGITYSEELYRKTGVRAPTGYGLMTLYCLKKFGRLPENCKKISTVMDAAVMRLTGNNIPVTHPTNAHSLGFFDIKKNEFMKQELKKAEIDPDILPEITDGVCGYYKGIPVSVAIGDNQAGIFGSLDSTDKMLVNVGTSSQISVITDNADALGGEVRPYLFGRYILIGAGLCGGRAYSALADFVAEILRGFGVEASRGDIYGYLNSEASKDIAEPLTVDTSFLGTREDASVRGSVKNLGIDNFTPSHFAKGILYGVLNEAYTMYKRMGFEDGAFIPVISGNAMRKNPELRRITNELFKHAPLVPKQTEEAAFGAALYGAVMAGIVDINDIGRYVRYE